MPCARSFKLEFRLCVGWSCLIMATVARLLALCSIGSEL